MRRELVPAGHRIAASGGYNGQGPIARCYRWRDQGYEAVAILFAGRDWFPGGPYNRSGRGSIPRRSTFIQDSKYLPLSQ